MRMICRAAAVLCAAFAAAAPAAAQNTQKAQAVNTKVLAATCANCHGTDGRAVEGSAVPGLAGMQASHISEQMKLFKSGGRPATVMHQIAKGYSDGQIEELAAYFAAQGK